MILSRLCPAMRSHQLNTFLPRGGIVFFLCEMLPGSLQSLHGLLSLANFTYENDTTSGKQQAPLTHVMACRQKI